LTGVFMQNEAALHNLDTFRSVEVLDAVEGVIKLYTFIWGSSDRRDAYDTWFDKSRPPSYSYNGTLSGYPVCYGHGQDSTYGKEPVGVITRSWFDDIGLANEAQLDRSHPLFQRTLHDCLSGKVKTSSSSASHMADFYDDGAFKNWMMTELSLTESPAEYDMPAVEVVRSSAEVSQDEIRADEPLAAPEHLPETEVRAMDINALLQQLQASGMDAKALVSALVTAGYQPAEIAAACQPQGMPQFEMQPATPDPAAPPMELPRSEDYINQIMEVLDTMRTEAEQVAQDAEVAALRAAVEEMKAATLAARNAPPVEDPTRHTPPTAPAGSVTVSEPRRYWDKSLPDLMFAHEVMKARGLNRSVDFMRAIAGRTEKAIAKGDDLVTNPAVRSLLSATRSDEIVTSSNTANGDEWVGVAYSGTLWETARSNRIFQMLQSKGMRVEEVPDGMESVVIFTEGSDPTVYTITQSQDLDATLRPTVVVPVTAPGTGQTTLTPGYLGMAIAYTSVFQEDSLIAASSQFNHQMQEKAQETIEQLFFNGDITSSTANVNKDGATDSTTSYYKASNGARYYALVTGSNTSRSAGTLDDDDYRLTLKLFPGAIRTRKDQMAFCIDPDTHNTSLGMLATKTEAERAQLATINSGVLKNIYGVDVLESGFIPLADTDGKVTSGGNVADTGSLLGIYAPYWAMGWKRRVTFETDKDILAQSNLIVATFRLGFKPRGAGAAVESYNVTIA
jgi:hypothetical protein